MSLVYHLFSELKEPGIYQRIDSNKETADIYIKEEFERPRTVREFVTNYYVDGDDACFADEFDKNSAPYVSYEKIDDLSGISRYLPEPMATLLCDPVADDRGVIYGNGGKTLIKAPLKLEGDYTCQKGVEVIFRYAFQNCQKLTKITFPSTLQKIGFAAFAGCRDLVSADLPESLVTMDGAVFSRCDSLEEAVIPAGVTEIPTGLFNGCKSIRRVVLHEGIQAIDGDAFESTQRLFELTLPRNLMPGIERTVELRDLDMEMQVSKLGSFTSFRYAGLTSIVIPGSVKTMEYGFYSCENLCYIEFEEGIEELGNLCGECGQLEYVVLPSTLNKVGPDIFKGSSPTVFIPEGTKEHFLAILPDRLHRGLREGAMTVEERKSLEKRIVNQKEKALEKIEKERRMFEELFR